MSKGDWGRTKAYCSITFDDCFVVTGLKVIEGRNGLFVSMPSQKDKNGEYKDIAFPVTSEMRQHIQEVVLNEYMGGSTPSQFNQREFDAVTELEDDDIPF